LNIEHYRSHIEAALKYGGDTHSFEDVVEMIEANDAQLWTGPDSVMVTQVVVYPRRKILMVWVAGGHLAELEAMAPAVEAWAKSEGCTGAMMLGRPGWERTFLARTGWKRTAVLMEKQWAVSN